MELHESSTREWHAYVAGFFDGEGAIGLSVAKQLVYSDEYRLRAELSQRIEFRCILDRVCTEFGGRVTIRHQSRKNAKWADIALWVVVKRSEVRLFLETLLPYLVVKRARADLALEYLDLVETQLRHSIRTSNRARWQGSNKLSGEELAARGVFYQRMLALNRFGNPV
jgi:hypothetical protein